MFVIANVECYEVEDDVSCILRTMDRIYATRLTLDLDAPINDLKIAEEIIHGRQYLNSRGEKIVIGIAGKPAKMIGVLLRDQEVKIGAMSDEIQDKIARIKMLESLIIRLDGDLFITMQKLWFRRFRTWLSIVCHKKWKFTFRPLLLEGWW